MNEQEKGLPHDIVDLTPYFDYVPWLIGAVAALIVILLGVYLWRKYGSRPVPAASPVIAVVDPIKIVIDRIKKLNPSEPFARKQQEEFFFDLSILFRELIEHRYGFAATDLTVKEFRPPFLKKVPLPEKEANEVIYFLERADLVKFAEQESTKEEALQYKQKVCEWTKKLVPKYDL